MSRRKRTLRFSFSYGELLSKALDKLSCLKRDTSILLGRGITEDRIRKFEESIETLFHSSTDFSSLGNINDASKRRDAKRRQIEVLGRDFNGIAEVAFIQRPAIYKLFKFDNFKKKSDAQMLISATGLLRNVNTYYAELSPNGLKKEMISDFEMLIEEFELSMKQLMKTKSERKLSTRDRQNAANALFAEMTYLCLIAGNYFRDRDAVKYSHYAIYPKTSSGKRNTESSIPKSNTNKAIKRISSDSVLELKNGVEASHDLYFEITPRGNQLTDFVEVPTIDEDLYLSQVPEYNSERGAIKLNNVSSLELEKSADWIKLE